MQFVVSILSILIINANKYTHKTVKLLGNLIMKERIVFTVFMSFQLSLLMSFWVTWLNLGWSSIFMSSWIQAFTFAWPAAMVISFMLSPLTQRLTLKLTVKQKSHKI